MIEIRIEIEIEITASLLETSLRDAFFACRNNGEVFWLVLELCRVDLSGFERSKVHAFVKTQASIAKMQHPAPNAKVQ